MTIEEVKQAKQKAQHDILKIVTDLQENTGCEVESFYLTTEIVFRGRLITGLDIDLRIK